MIVASIMPVVAGGIMAVLSVAASWAGNRRRARGQAYIYSRRAVEDQFKRPRDESELL